MRAQRKTSVYETDIFADTIEKISQLTGRTYGADEETTRAFRVVLDHVRTATFMIGDEKGISPSNTDQGYILRRIIRRAVRYGRKIDLPEGSLSQIAATFVEKYKAVYPELETNRARDCGGTRKGGGEILQNSSAGSEGI